VNADDFGRSSSINEAVIKAHREGILTTASLMVNGSAFAEAVELARQNPKLGVGLHLSLICGRSTLKPTEIPGLVDNRYQFSDNPVATGFRYFSQPALRAQLRHEIVAQFQKFAVTKLKMDHVNGHLNMHMHPTIFSILRHHAHELNIKHMRVTRDRFWLNTRIAGGEWLYRISHAVIFNLLSRQVRSALRRQGIKHTRHVFGLLQNSRVHEDYITGLLPHLPPGDSELYSHPSLDEFKHEYDALVSPAVRQMVDAQRVRLIRYQDL
jgi:hopanoid biosynthesis associated protein HpnK